MAEAYHTLLVTSKEQIWVIFRGGYVPDLMGMAVYCGADLEHVFIKGEQVYL